MPKPICFVTRAIPQAPTEALAELFELRIAPQDAPIERAELLNGVADAEALLCMLTDRVDAELLAAAPKLRFVATYSVGFNHIDLAACSARGVKVINTPDTLTQATADLTWGLILDVARGISSGDRAMRAVKGFPGWGPVYRLGREVSGKTLGIIGMGRIGQAVAQRAKGFHMKVLYHQRRTLDSDLERALGAQKLGLEDLLQQCDFVSLHCPLTPETQGLLSLERLSLMKPSAYLINTARGPLVDEAGLAKLVREGKLAGAGLDVFTKEPQIHPDLWPLNQVVLVPHIGSATIETREAMGHDLAKGLAVLMNGLRPNNILN